MLAFIQHRSDLSLNCIKVRCDMQGLFRSFGHSFDFKAHWVMMDVVD